MTAILSRPEAVIDERPLVADIRSSELRFNAAKDTRAAPRVPNGENRHLNLLIGGCRARLDSTLCRTRRADYRGQFISRFQGLSFNEEAFVGHANFEGVPSTSAAAEEPAGNRGSDNDGFRAHPLSVSTLSTANFKSSQADGRDSPLMADSSLSAPPS